MANEITVNSTFAVAKGNVSTSKTLNNRINMSGAVAAGLFVSVATTAAGVALGIGTVGTCGVSYFKNLDASNYIEIGIQTGGTFFPLVKLKPGEGFPFRLAVNAPYARANTAACLMEYQITED